MIGFISHEILNVLRECPSYNKSAVILGALPSPKDKVQIFGKVPKSNKRIDTMGIEGHEICVTGWKLKELVTSNVTFEWGVGVGWSL